MAGLIEKLTVPGFADVEVPLKVFNVSQLAPGSCVALQLTVELPETATRKEPFELPGEEPNACWNWVPAGLRVMVGFCARSSVRGTLTEPADVFTRMVL